MHPPKPGSSTAKNVAVCSLCSTTFTRTFYPGRNHFHRKEQEKGAFCKILRYLRVPKKEADTLLKDYATFATSYCLTCGKSFDGIIQLLEEIERLKLLVKWKAERVGRRIVKEGVKGGQPGGTVVKPLILKYFAGAPRNPSVRLTRMHPAKVDHFLKLARERSILWSRRMEYGESDDDDVEVIAVVTSPSKDTSRCKSVGGGLKNGGDTLEEGTETSTGKLPNRRGSGNSSSVEGVAANDWDRKGARSKPFRPIVDKEAPKVSSQDINKSPKKSIGSGAKVNGVWSTSNGKTNVEKVHELTDDKSSDLKSSNGKKKLSNGLKTNKVDSKTTLKSLANSTGKEKERKPIYDSVYDSTDSDSDDLFEEIKVITIRKEKLKEKPLKKGTLKSEGRSSKSISKSSTDLKKPTQERKRTGSLDAAQNNSSQSKSTTNSKRPRTDERSVSATIKDTSVEQYFDSTAKVKPSPLKTSESKDGPKASVMQNQTNPPSPAKRALQDSDDDLFVPISAGGKSRTAKGRHSQSSPLKSTRKSKTGKGSKTKSEKQTDEQNGAVMEILPLPEADQTCSEIAPGSSSVELKSKRRSRRSEITANATLPTTESVGTDKITTEVPQTVKDITVQDEETYKGSKRKSTAKPINNPSKEVTCVSDYTATKHSTQSNAPSETMIEACVVIDIPTQDNASCRGSTKAKTINSPAKESTNDCNVTDETAIKASSKVPAVPVATQDNKLRRISTRASNKTKLINNSTKEIPCASELSAATVPTIDSNVTSETAMNEADETDVNTPKTCRASKRSATKTKPTANSVAETAYDSDDDLFTEIHKKPRQSSKKLRRGGSKSTENKLPVTPPISEGNLSNAESNDFTAPFMELIEISPVKDYTNQSETECEELNDPLAGIGESTENQAEITDFTNREKILVCEFCGLQFIDISMDDEQLKMHLKQHISMYHTETDLKPIILNDGSVVYVHIPVDDEVDSNISPETPSEDEMLNEIVVTVIENASPKKKRRAAKVKKSPKKKQPKLKMPASRRKGTPMLRTLITESLKNAEEAELDLATRNEELQDSTVESTTTNVDNDDERLIYQYLLMQIYPSKSSSSNPLRDGTFDLLTINPKNILASLSADLHNYSVKCNSEFICTFSSKNATIEPKPDPEDSPSHGQNTSSKSSISPWPPIEFMCEVCDSVDESSELKILHMKIEHFYCDVCVMPLSLSFEDYLTHKMTHKSVEEQQTLLQSRVDLPRNLRECLISHHDADPEQFTFSNCLLGEVMYLMEAQVPAVSVGSFVKSKRKNLGCGICGGFIKITNQFDEAVIISAMRQLKDHYTLTHFRRLYICYICGQRFSVRNHLDGHYLDAHPNNYFPCPECQKPHGSLDILGKHRKTHLKKAS